MIAQVNHLTVLGEAARILAEAKTLPEIKSIRDKAEAARSYVKAARLGLELQNHAAEVKLRAERKAGELLGSLKLPGGNRRSKSYHTTLKLDSLGVTRDQSAHWQRLAAVSEEDFTAYLREIANQERELTSAGLLRIAARLNRPAPIPPRRPAASRRRIPDWNPHETLDELKNHCRQLDNLLRPLADQPAAELNLAERRLVGRLLRELTQIAEQLNSVWPETLDPNSP